MRSGYGRVASVALLLLVSRSLSAADNQEDALIKQGVEHRRHDDDSGALELFSKAYELHHAPRALAQMALARMALGQWVQAEAELQEALAADDPWIRKTASVLREALDRLQTHVSRLEVLGTPAGAEVVVGGEVRGKLPMDKPVTLIAGEYTLEVRAPGHGPVKRTVQILPGQRSRETVVLVPSPATAAHPTETPPPASVPKDARVPSVSDAVSSPPGQRSGLRTWGLVAGAAGVAAVGAGLVFGVLARADGEANSKSGGTFDPSVDSQGRRFQTLQFVGYGVGAALLAVGTTLFVLGSRTAGEGDAAAHGTRVSFVPVGGGQSVDGGMVAVGGRF